MTFDKNIPIPNNYVTAKKYHFEDMELNDSVLISDKKERSDISCSINRAQKMTGFKFTTRKVPEGIRVWRIK